MLLQSLSRALVSRFRRMLESLRMRSLRVPEEELMPDEKRALEKSRKEFENGKYVALEDVLKEFASVHRSGD